MGVEGISGGEKIRGEGVELIGLECKKHKRTAQGTKQVTLER